jgi:hypothetical protein
VRRITVAEMNAKAPLDVDLEDKLLYGLTPIRLAYLVVALLAGIAVWSSPWAPSPVRLVASLIVVALGAAGAWGRWQGRAADAWVADISIFLVNTHRVSWNTHSLRRLVRRPLLPRLASHRARPIAAGDS